MAQAWNGKLRPGERLYLMEPIYTIHFNLFPKTTFTLIPKINIYLNVGTGGPLRLSIPPPTDPLPIAGPKHWRRKIVSEKCPQKQIYDIILSPRSPSHPISEGPTITSNAYHPVDRSIACLVVHTRCLTFAISVSLLLKIKLYIQLQNLTTVLSRNYIWIL